MSAGYESSWANIELGDTVSPHKSYTPLEAKLGRTRYTLAITIRIPPLVTGRLHSQLENSTYIYIYIHTWQILVVHGEDDDQVEEGRKNFEHQAPFESPSWSPGPSRTSTVSREAVRRRNFKLGGTSWSNSFPCLSFRAGVTRLCLRIVRVRVPVIRIGSREICGPGRGLGDGLIVTVVSPFILFELVRLDISLKRSFRG